MFAWNFRAQAMIAGSITGEISLEMVPQEADVKAGDLVLTSGLGGGFPANIFIGQVSGVRKRDQDLYQRASVHPVVDFSQLSIVLVITNFQPIDYEPLISTE
jgi:rod shape-determining protein MreC